MDVVETIFACRQRRQLATDNQRSVALVPTMGFLHQGHLSLVRRARELGDSVWVSIFVNPTQFEPDEDFDAYPRDLAADLALLRAEGVDVVFAPSVREMYPEKPVVEVGFSGLERVLCGTDRPNHFAGVGLVVSQLFHIINPSVAVFGQKDAQQALLIRRLASDLHFPVEIEVAPTVRETDGLAMSSRNAYLNREERAAAPAIYDALCRAKKNIQAGETDPGVIRRAMIDRIARESVLSLQYAECVDQKTLEQVQAISAPVLLAMAVRASKARLIDNLLVSPAEETTG